MISHKKLVIHIVSYEFYYIQDRGCPAATLRVWPWTHERTPLELCGDSLEEHSQILSESNLMQAS